MFKGNNSKEQAAPTNQINRLVEGTVINGDLLTDGNIRIDGHINGNLSIKGKLVLGATGRVDGDIKSLNADIEGTVHGNISVDGLLILKDTASVQGTITTHKIGILEGAEFTGQCIMNSNVSQPIQDEIKLDTEADPEMVY